MFISKQGISKTVGKGGISSEDNIKVFFFLVNPTKESRMQLRMLSRFVNIVEREGFVEKMLSMTNHREIKEYLLHNERFITVSLLPGTIQEELIGKQLREIQLPADVLVALVERNSESFPPHGNTILQENDVLTIIGEPRSIAQMFSRYISSL